jgi:hypothetical protein
MRKTFYLDMVMTPARQTKEEGKGPTPADHLGEDPASNETRKVQSSDIFPSGSSP